MSDPAQQPEERAPRKRGEAAWKEAREQVADRNAQARKAGKQEREIYERDRTAVRLAAEKRRMAGLSKLDTKR